MNVDDGSWHFPCLFGGVHVGPVFRFCSHPHLHRPRPHLDLLHLLSGFVFLHNPCHGILIFISKRGKHFISCVLTLFGRFIDYPHDRKGGGLDFCPIKFWLNNSNFLQIRKAVELSFGVRARCCHTFLIFQPFRLWPDLGKPFILWIAFRKLQDSSLCCDGWRSTQVPARVLRSGNVSPSPYALEHASRTPPYYGDLTTISLGKYYKANQAQEKCNQEAFRAAVLDDKKGVSKKSPSLSVSRVR